MAINNPYIPGDPYSYDLKWLVAKVKEILAQLGTLDEAIEAKIFEGFLEHSIVQFKTVPEMLAADITDGSIVLTLGYHEEGDKGALFYLVKDFNPGQCALDYFLTMDNNAQIAIPLFVYPYVTPEMFGAKGDGTEDDANALKMAMNAGGVVVFSDKTYLTNEQIDITASHCQFIGNGATIKRESEGNLVIIKPECDGISFSDLSFYAPISTQISTGVVVAQKASATAGIGESANNITFEGCTFEGGTIELGLYSVTGAKVEGCTFKNTAATAQGLIGGYCVLIQSAYDVQIERCLFTEQKQVRHSVYISVDPSKTSNIQNKNVSVKGCYFDHSAQTYYTTNTSAINTRATENAVISGNTFYKCVGISFVSEDGEIFTSVTDNVFLESAYRNVASETKYIINFVNGAADDNIYLHVENNVERGGNGGNFATFGPNCYGDFIHNRTDQATFVTLDGYVNVDDFSCTNSYAYRVDTTTYQGKIGHIVECTATAPITLTTACIYLRQLPMEWLQYRIAEGYNTIAGSGQHYISASSTKNAVNDYTMNLDAFKDTWATIVPSGVQEPCLLKVEIPSTSPLKVRIQAIKPSDGTAFTSSTLNQQRFYLRPVA